MRFARFWLVALMTVAVGSLAFAQNPAPVPSTSILVPKMHCVGCAKKMATELYKVPGVGQVLVSVETMTLTVRAKNGQAASPRGLWEAVEKAGYKPSKIEGPSGTFKEKPKS